MCTEAFFEKFPILCEVINLIFSFTVATLLVLTPFWVNTRINTVVIGKKDFDESGRFLGNTDRLLTRSNLHIRKNLGHVVIEGDIELAGDLSIGRGTHLKVIGKLRSYKYVMGRGTAEASEGTEFFY